MFLGLLGQKNLISTKNLGVFTAKSFLVKNGVWICIDKESFFTQEGIGALSKFD